MSLRQGVSVSWELYKSHVIEARCLNVYLYDSGVTDVTLPNDYLYNSHESSKQGVSMS